MSKNVCVVQEILSAYAENQLTGFKFSSNIHFNVGKKLYDKNQC